MIREGWVYLIGDRKRKVAKIGFTTKVPEARLSRLGTAYPGRLEVLARFRGDERHERALHYKFDELRLYGEWFRLDPAIRTAFASEGAGLESLFGRTAPSIAGRRRRGQPKKPDDERRRQFCVWTTPAVIAEMGRLAEERGVSRGALLEEWVAHASASGPQTPD